MELQELELLLKINEQTKLLGKKFPKKRYLFEKLVKEQKTKIITGISGLRGSGKTVLLSQLLNYLNNAFYLTGDIPLKTNLYNLAEYLNKNYHINFLLIDEIHRQKNWEKELKLIYDYLPIKVYFTSSVSLNIFNLQSDLSRRIIILELPIFSFREYLDFCYQIKIPKLSLNKIITDYQSLLQKYYSQESYFKEFLFQPLPFLLENPSPQLIKQIAYKVIENDIFFAGDYSSSDIEGMKNVISFVANTPISEVNYSVLSKNLGITKYKAKQYVEVLEKAYLLRTIFPYSSSVIKEPKIILQLPFRLALNFRLLPDQIDGALKEEFFVHSLYQAGYTLFYLKSKRGAKTPDYLLLDQNKKYIFEIGGKKKGYSQFKGINSSYQKYIVTFPAVREKNKIPLILFGLL